MWKQYAVDGIDGKADQPPSAEHMLAIVRRYLLKEAAQAFAAAKLAQPGSTLVLFTVRPDRWWTGDFSEDAGKPPSAN